MSLLFVQELCEDERERHIPYPFFYNDTVYRHTSTGIEFGHVLYPHELPADISDIESVLQYGFKSNLRIYWIHSKSIQSHPPDDAEVHLQTRLFLPGMRARKKYSATYGRVLSVNRTCSVRVVETEQVISHVPSEHLLPQKRVQVGDYVQIREWIGIVTSVEWEAVFQIFDNDMQCSYTWEETAQSRYSSTESTNHLSDKINYVGQTVRLSLAQVLFDLQWPCYSFLYGQLKALRSTDLIGTVVSLTPTYKIEWLHQIPCNFHQQSPKPLATYPDSEGSLLVFPKPPLISIGRYYKLSTAHQANWQFKSFTEWQETFRSDTTVLPTTTIPSRDSAIQIWNQLRNVSSFARVDMGDASQVFTVKILSTQDWITLIDSSSGNNVSYVNSAELEPMLLADLPAFPPLGSVVTSPNDGLPLSSCYGVVIGFNDSTSHMYVNWYKLQYNKSTFLGLAETPPEGVVIHPDFTLVPGQIVFSPEPILHLHSKMAFAGVFEKVGADGLLHVRDTANEIHKFLPYSLKPFYWICNYDCIRKSWTLSHTGSQRHLGETTSPNPSPTFFCPPQSVLAKVPHRSFPLLSDSSMSDQIFMQAPVISEAFSGTNHSLLSLVSDLRKYTGEESPKIYLKLHPSNASTFHAVIQGSEESLYQDFLLFFTIQLPPNYPGDPPVFTYHSFSSGLVNPCLLTNGQVLFPLLNTYPKFPGLYQENWVSTEHSLGLVLAAIQKILLCSIPYQHDRKFALLKLISSSVSQHRCLLANLNYMENIIESIQNQLESPLEEWRSETLQFYRVHLPRFYNRIANSFRICKKNKSLTSIPLPIISKEKETLLQNKLNHLKYLYDKLM